MVIIGCDFHPSFGRRSQNLSARAKWRWYPRSRRGLAQNRLTEATSLETDDAQMVCPSLYGAQDVGISSCIISSLTCGAHALWRAIGTGGDRNYWGQRALFHARPE
jgi:hypothetical protein